MDSDTSETYEHLYKEEDAPKHAKLVQKILSLNKSQNVKKPSRTEPSLQISEFNLVKSITGEKGSVQIKELTKPLKSRKSRVKISENVKRIEKSSHILPKPLERPRANRIRRTVAYEKTRLELDRWEPTITANRVSTNLSFPLDHDVKMNKKESENFVSMWRVKSKLEEELEKHEPKVEEFHINLDEEKFPLTMKEMLTRRKEAAKLRAYQGYKEAKARRQNKIKSKKYHRIQKRERIKKKLKEFEELQKTNPEEALKKLDEIEKSRVQERFSLRHKSTGKWAKNQQIRAKYDKESRQVLAQQLTLSRELTQKQKSVESESEDEEAAETGKSLAVVDEDNPWINGIKPSEEVASFINSYKKYWLKQNENQENETNNKLHETPEVDTENRDFGLSNSAVVSNDEKIQEREQREPEFKKKKKEGKIRANKEQEQRKLELKKRKKESKANINEEIDKSHSTSDWDVSVVDDEIEEMFSKLESKIQKKKLNNVKKLKKKLNVKAKPIHNIEDEKENEKIDLSLPLQKKVPQIDDELVQNSGRESETHNGTQDLIHLKNILLSQSKQKESNLDPNMYINVKPTNLSTGVPDILTIDENEEEVSQRDIISEAFVDDDIVDEFNKEKKDEINRNKPKNIDLSLPGWGSWGGTNIKVNKRKKRRFTIKAPAKVPRRDDNKGSLIINESAQSAIKEHLVSELPFPFKTVKDFEASIRMPISNTFVPETAYKKLIKPAVTTKMGTIIEPISKDILLNKSS